MKAWDDRGRAVQLKASWLRSKFDGSISPPLKIGPEQIRRSDIFERKIAAELIISLAVIIAGCIYFAQFLGGITIMIAMGSLLAAMWRAAARMDLVSGIHSMLGKPQCPACDHLLTGVPPQDDGCTVCPECGAAWRLPN